MFTPLPKTNPLFSFAQRREQRAPWLIKENQYLDATRWLEVSNPVWHEGAALFFNRPHRQSHGKAETWIPTGAAWPLLIGQEWPQSEAIAWDPRSILGRSHPQAAD